MLFGALGFLRIELLVGVRKKLLDALAIAAINGNADARRQLWFFLVFGHHFADAAGDQIRFRFLRFRKHQRELIAAVSCRRIDRPTMDPQNIRQAAQCPAAYQVPVRIVDLLQPIEVQQQHRERPSIAVGALGLAL